MSGDAAYRYRLDRLWLWGDGCVCWVMLNPSTADDVTDDATIRRVTRFSRDAGYQRLTVVNLYALRLTDPSLLLQHANPEGPGLWPECERAIAEADAVVLAWGAHAPVGQAQRMESMIREARPHVDVLCLGRTKSGAPRHPLYVPAARRLELFR